MAGEKAVRVSTDWEERAPRFSIVMPVHDPELEDLRRAVASVRSQAWPKVELCVVDDASQKSEVVAFLESLAKEPGVRSAVHVSARGIAGATNAALDLATGEFAVFLDHDDELCPGALVRLAEEIRESPEVDFLYSDHDVVDEEGCRLQVSFKPDWSPELLLSYMYIGHVKVCRTQLARDVGGFREGFDGAADYDFMLRIAEKTQSILHVPEVLYHWRAASNSMARRSDTKPQAFESGRRAVQEALERRAIAAEAEWPLWAQRARIGVYRSRFVVPQPAPRVALLIPTRDRLDLLRDCITSIEERTDYDNWEIVILDNDSREPDTLDYFAATPHRVISVPGEFNFSRIVNRGVEEVDADCVVLLNNDIIVVTPDWLHELVGSLALRDVGAVGAKLVYPDGRIQHAGVTMGIHGLTAHAFDGHPDRFSPLEPGYFAHVMRNVSAVTAACLITRRDTYLEVGGFDEQDLGVAWNDTDFCLRLIERGQRIVMNPHAELIHVGSASRGDAKNDYEVSVMFDRWADQIDRDPFYNPNLSRLETDFRARTHLDERSCFHYTDAGFRAVPPGSTPGETAFDDSQPPPLALLAEICRNQQVMIDQVSGSLARRERSDALASWISSRPLLMTLQRSRVWEAFWAVAWRVRRSPLGGRVLRRLGLVAR